MAQSLGSTGPLGDFGARGGRRNLVGSERLLCQKDFSTLASTGAAGPDRMRTSSPRSMVLGRRVGAISSDHSFEEWRAGPPKGRSVAGTAHASPGVRPLKSMSNAHLALRRSSWYDRPVEISNGDYMLLWFTSE